MVKNLKFALSGIGLLLASTAWAAPGDEFVVQKGQVSCATEADLDAYVAKKATDANTIPDGTCHAFDAPVKVEVLDQKSANRIHIRVRNGQSAGAVAWMNRM